VKERLTGAIILVALMVLLVPELLTGPIRTESAASARAVHIGQGSRANSALRTYTLTLGAAPSAQERASAAQTQSAQAAAESVTPSNGPRLGAAPADVPAKAARVPARSSAARSSLQVAKSPAHRSLVREARSSASHGGWVVQLGSFASRDNANRLARSLERRGFRVAVSPGRAGSRVLWRVRAGPAHDRASAQRLAARLHALGHRGELLPLK
jgi:cell division septation protein DedD